MNIMTFLGSQIFPFLSGKFLAGLSRWIVCVQRIILGESIFFRRNYISVFPEFGRKILQTKAKISCQVCQSCTLRFQRNRSAESSFSKNLHLFNLFRVLFTKIPHFEVIFFGKLWEKNFSRVVKTEYYVRRITFG